MKTKIILALALFAVSNCVHNAQTSPADLKKVPGIEAPKIIPDGVIFANFQQVEIAQNPETDFSGVVVCASGNGCPLKISGRIVYTIDGTAPDCELSPEYVSAFTVTADTIVKAKQCTTPVNFESATVQAAFLKTP